MSEGREELEVAGVEHLGEQLERRPLRRARSDVPVVVGRLPRRRRHRAPRAIALGLEDLAPERGRDGVEVGVPAPPLERDQDCWTASSLPRMPMSAANRRMDSGWLTSICQDGKPRPLYKAVRCRSCEATPKRSSRCCTPRARGSRPRAEADRDLAALVHGRPPVGGEEPVEERARAAWRAGGTPRRGCASPATPSSRARAGGAGS